MPLDDRRRQKSLQRKVAKRKEKRRLLASFPLPGRRRQAEHAAAWPLYECLITKNWQDEGELVQILVARQSPDGQLGAAVFLVDLACLGVKNAFTHVVSSRREYDQSVRAAITSTQRLVRADLNLAAKIVRDAIAYAGSLGFKPHPDYREAAPFLSDANPDASATPVPLGGPEGKPYFVSGPHDNVDRIFAQLMRAVGPGNFHFTIGVPELPAELLDSLELLDEAEFELLAEDEQDDAEGEA